jgi:chitin synthase
MSFLEDDEISIIQEFFNQRRRWVPSTIANIIDFLAEYKRIVVVNDSISYFYIIYQLFLMVSTVLGPATVLLMIIGAFNACFGRITAVKDVS